MQIGDAMQGIETGYDGIQDSRRFKGDRLQAARCPERSVQSRT